MIRLKLISMQFHELNDSEISEPHLSFEKFTSLWLGNVNPASILHQREGGLDIVLLSIQYFFQNSYVRKNRLDQLGIAIQN